MPGERRAMSFQEALAEHLAAIQARDIGRFAATVARDPEVRVVDPGGRAIVGHDAVVEAHRGWFEGTGWTFSPHTVLARAGEGLAFALLDVEYRDDGGARRFLLSLVFTPEDGTWKLLYDQNTTCAA